VAAARFVSWNGRSTAAFAASDRSTAETGLPSQTGTVLNRPCTARTPLLPSRPGRTAPLPVLETSFDLGSGDGCVGWRMGVGG